MCKRAHVGIPKRVESACFALLPHTLLCMPSMSLRMRPNCAGNNLLPCVQPYKLLDLLLLKMKPIYFLFMAFPASGD